VFEHVLDWAHRRARHALAEALLPFERVARGERGAQFGHQLSGMRGPAAHRRAPRVTRQLRPADQLAQCGKEMVRVNLDIEPAFFRGMNPGEPAGTGITRYVAALALRPNKTPGLDCQGAAQ
jgi:hypothetical protein